MCFGALFTPRGGITAVKLELNQCVLKLLQQEYKIDRFVQFVSYCTTSLEVASQCIKSKN